MQKIAVIGRGLIGSAAARHLASQGHAPALIGPGEPEDKRAHQGVFASHYDEGRITRKNATDPFWSEVSAASIARYREIEAISGIRFFTDCGAAMIGPDDGDFMADCRRTAAGRGIAHQDMSAVQLRSAFPYFRFAPGLAGLYEPDGAGHISPRRLVAAQTLAAERAGARVLDTRVRGIEDIGNGVRVEMESGSLIFDRVLVAAGAMSDHVLGRTSQLRVFGRTVALFRISAENAAPLAGMPTAVLRLPGEYYLLPPIRYPDGQLYLKLGGDPEDIVLNGAAEIADWFRAGGNPAVRDHLEGVFRQLMPEVVVDAVEMDACVTTWSADGYPEIGRLSPRIAVATAGCGAGAKCSDELGRRGAAALMELEMEGLMT